jgi:nucleotide-binding universal stress UspA family protein
MTKGEFSRVLVPVEFRSLEKDETTEGQVVDVGDDRVAVGPITVRALELGARLAREGELWLVHAHHNFSDYATWMSVKNMDELNEQASVYTTRVLEAIAAKHCPDVNLHYVISAGAALDVILQVAEQHPPDVIVLAASSRSRVNRALLGSTADKVIRRAVCPVMVVPSGIF